jgi:NADH-quinone oxidoreductase subunit M
VLTLVPIVACCFWIGLYPKPFFDVLERPVAEIVERLEGGGAAPVAAASAASPGAPAGGAAGPAGTGSLAHRAAGSAEHGSSE